MSPTVGKTLRAARTKRGIDLDEVERATRIRAKFLIAMEEDRWEDLPAPAYARGFLEIYARFLALDREALLEQYRKATGDDYSPEPFPPEVVKPSRAGRRRRAVFGRTRSLKPAGFVAAGLVGAVLLVLIIVAALGGSDDGDDGGSEGSRSGAVAGRATTEDRATTREDSTAEEDSTTTETQTTGTRVELELRATAPIWVCLVDGRGDPLVNGETLAPGERRGPFDGPLFAVRFGNGSVEMTVDGELARIPALAEPFGYRISPSGLRRLEPADQPTCA